MKYSSRFFLWAPLGVFLALLAIAGIHWWIAAGRLGDWLDAHNGREIMPGVRFAFAERHITGFPFSLDTQMRDVTITVATPRGMTRWTAEKFAMHGLTYGRNETIFEAAGHQSLAWTDGTTRSLPFAVGALRASAIAQHGMLSRFDLDLVGFGSKAFTAQAIQFHVRAGAKLEFLVSAASPRAANCWPMVGPAILQLSGRASHGDAFAALLSANQVWVSAVQRWRARGGTVDSLQVLMSPSDKQPYSMRDRLRALNAETLPSLPSLIGAVCGPTR